MKAHRKRIHAITTFDRLRERTLLFKKGLSDDVIKSESDHWVAIRTGLCAGNHPCHIDLPPGVRPQDESKGAKRGDCKWWSFKFSSKMRLIVALTDTTVTVESLSASDHPKRFTCKRR